MISIRRTVWQNIYPENKYLSKVNNRTLGKTCEICSKLTIRTPERRHWFIQKQPTRGVLKKRCSENMRQIYRRTPMQKCDFNKVELVGCFCWQFMGQFCLFLKCYTLLFLLLMQENLYNLQIKENINLSWCNLKFLPCDHSAENRF